MNSGVVLGAIKQGGRPLPNATVGLSWVRGGGQRLNLYDANADSPQDRLRAQASRGVLTTAMPQPLNTHIPISTVTNNQGGFILSFQWSGTDLGIAMDSPHCQIWVQDWVNNAGMAQSRLRGTYQLRMVRFVSLSQTMSGLIANPTQAFDQLGEAASQLADLRGMMTNMLGSIRIGAPSPDMYIIGAAFYVDY